MATKLLLIDGNAILHRAYHALPSNLTSKSGEPINAVYGFVSMLVRIITDIKPTHIAVCFDTPVETFRKAEYVGYQAHRPRLESDLSSQFEMTYKVLDAMNIPIYKLERYEADDVIGTIVAQVATQIKNLKLKIKNSPSQENGIVIVTGDRDILQLVNDELNVNVYMPVKGLKDMKLYKEQDVIGRMGVKSSQIVDYKALAGDSSDNYPGVTGIGPKTAISLLEKYNNLENVYEKINEIPPKIATKLAIGIESAGMSKKLATIVKDAPITFHLNDSANWSLNNQKVLDLFAEIGFKTLTNRVKQLPLI